MPLHKALMQKKTERPYVWLMRQAGRYLPEYRELRSTTDGFLSFCLDEKKATEATLQPLRRFDLDAAIVFSDILIVPYALGQPLTFKEGEGPVLQPIKNVKDLPNADLGHAFLERISPTCNALSSVRATLSKDHSVIGFAGAPWTVLSYMLEGRGVKSYTKSLAFFIQEPLESQAILDVVVDATILYLTRQVQAGADVLQIFDSWAGAVPAHLLDRLVYAPTKKIVSSLKRLFPNLPIIGFPRGLGEKYFEYAALTGVDAVNLDAQLDLAWVQTQAHDGLVLQGGIDPHLLLGSTADLERVFEGYRHLFAQTPYVFNLGHGIFPETSVDAVERLIRLIKSGKSNV